MLRVANNSFSRGVGAGSGVAIGLAGAASIIVAAIAAWYWLSQPIAPVPQPKPVGTAEQAERIALSALQKRGISKLANETRAVFKSGDNQWLVYGPAETDDGRLVRVSVLLSVGTFSGKQRWKVEALEIDGKIYVGK